MKSSIINNSLYIDKRKKIEYYWLIKTIIIDSKYAYKSSKFSRLMNLFQHICKFLSFIHIIYTFLSTILPLIESIFLTHIIL